MSSGVQRPNPSRTRQLRAERLESVFLSSKLMQCSPSADADLFDENGLRIRFILSESYPSISDGSKLDSVSLFRASGDYSP